MYLNTWLLRVLLSALLCFETNNAMNDTNFDACIDTSAQERNRYLSLFEPVTPEEHATALETVIKGIKVNDIRGLVFLMTSSYQNQPEELQLKNHPNFPRSLLIWSLSQLEAYPSPSLSRLRPLIHVIKVLLKIFLAHGADPDLMITWQEPHKPHQDWITPQYYAIMLFYDLDCPIDLIDHIGLLHHYSKVNIPQLQAFYYAMTQKNATHHAKNDLFSRLIRQIILDERLNRLITGNINRVKFPMSSYFETSFSILLKKHRQTPLAPFSDIDAKYSKDFEKEIRKKLNETNKQPRETQASTVELENIYPIMVPELFLPIIPQSDESTCSKCCCIQ